VGRFLFSSRGRLDRLGYLSAVLAAALLFVLPPAMLVGGVYPDALRWPTRGLFEHAVLMAGGILWIVAAWIYVCATARRLHDANRSGWLTTLALIPAVGLPALTLSLLLLPGTAGENRFGAKWL
jgi:uncharacterized membrane protein YhaH (DUF805 family)